VILAGSTPASAAVVSAMSTCIAAVASSRLASSSRSGSALPSRKPRIHGPIDRGHTRLLQNGASNTTTTLMIIPSARPR
jgi:hypothetical protein